MGTINHTPTLLERARLQKQQADEEMRRKEALAHEESLVTRRRSFGWALAKVLDLGYDQKGTFPDNSFPGRMEWGQDDGKQEWQYVQDGLTFVPCPYYSSDLVLLQGQCAYCEGRAYQQVSHITQLVLLTDSSVAWECDYCRAKRTEEEEIDYTVRIADDEPQVVEVPPTAERRLLDALDAWVNDIITARLSDHYAEDHC